MAHHSRKSAAFPTTASWRSLLPIVLLLALVAATAAHAQVEAINGSIRGRVADPNGAAVPSATITAKNTATGYTRSVDSGTDGYYVLPGLPLGSYTVTIEKAGFATLEHPGVVLEAGTEAVINAQLKVSSVATTVTVTGGTPILAPSSAYVGRTINSRETENLPLTSRNPYNFILFQPGVSGHPNPELGIPRTVNTNGQMDRINYQLDGMTDTESDRYGLRLFPISDTYVREVQTVANSFAPEFGNTTGIIYNVITNSGTNQFHGMFHWIDRPVATSARPMLLKPTQAKPDLQMSDYAANAGGPIIKDKLFAFGAYEYMRRGQPSPVTINPTQAALIGISPSLLATAPSIEHAQFVDSRLDWDINSKNRMFIRYNYFRNEFPFNTNVGGLYALDASSDFHDRAYVAGMQLVTTLSPTLLNEFRFSWPYRKELHQVGPLTGPGPAILIQGVANFNGTTAAGDFFAEKIPSWNDNVTWIHGAHSFKTGFYVNKILDDQVSDTYSQFVFPSIAAYQLAESGANPYSYSTYNATIGNTNTSYHSLFWGLYAQDSWQIRPTLMIIYGLRWDKYIPPSANPNAPFVYSRTFPSPSGDIQPRLGLAWQVTPRTVVRASFGKFYDAPPTNLWFNALSNDGSNRSFVAHIPSTSPFAPAFPNVISQVPGLTLPPADVTTISPEFKNPYALTTSLQVSRELTRNDSLTVGYVLTEGHQLTYLRNINLINPIGQLGDGRPIFSSTISSATRMDPQFNNITLQDTGANSNYNAMLLTYNHRWSQGFQMSASYTFSHTISDAPDVNSFEQNLSIEDLTNRVRDRGNSSINRPQALTISTVLDPKVTVGNSALNRLLNDNMFAFLVNVASGDEQNIRANKVLNGDSTTSSVTRPLFIGRNTVRGPAIAQVDVRYTRDLFHLWERVTPQFIFEANNLFNRHSNVTALNTVVPVDSAGNAILPSSFPYQSTVLEARYLQFGLAVRW
jgi:Carboxypeptidase regulatory-like domain/TonB dependent receptor-like, beta-barrel